MKNTLGSLGECKHVEKEKTLFYRKHVIRGGLGGPRVVFGEHLGSIWGVLGESWGTLGGPWGPGGSLGGPV